MKRKLTITLALAAVGCICWLACLVRVENIHGSRRLIIAGRGACNQSSDYTEARKKHYAYGKLYPVEVYYGELVPPGEPPKPEGFGKLWMCRYHAAQWLGEDLRGAR